jgi:hypothetical protein
MNLLLDHELVEAAKRYFPTTRYRTVSGFAEAMLRREFRINAVRLRKAGIPIPASLFAEESHASR